MDGMRLEAFHPVEVRRLIQVHGIAVLDDAGFPAVGEVEGDGLVTSRDGVVLVIRTADCIPLFLMDVHRVGLVHAGWRGVAGGICRKALSHFERESVRVILGPGICQRHYEVGSELVGPWLAREPELSASLVPSPSRRGHHLLDLKGHLRKMLLGQGVASERVFDIPICTYASSLPSYRRDAGTDARILNYIFRIPH